MRYFVTNCTPLQRKIREEIYWPVQIKKKVHLRRLSFEYRQWEQYFTLFSSEKLSQINYAKYISIRFQFSLLSFKWRINSFHEPARQIISHQKCSIHVILFRIYYIRFDKICIEIHVSKNSINLTTFSIHVSGSSFFEISSFYAWIENIRIFSICNNGKKLNTINL